MFLLQLENSLQTIKAGFYLALLKTVCQPNLNVS